VKDRHIERIKSHLASRYDLGPVDELKLYGILHGTDSAGIVTTWSFFHVIDANMEVSQKGAISAETHPMRDGVCLVVWSSVDLQRLDD